MALAALHPKVERARAALPGRNLIAAQLRSFQRPLALVGNQYELNCYDYERIRVELVETDGISPVRY